MINAIAAVGIRGQIGLSGLIPWIEYPALQDQVKADLQWFAKTTAGGIIVVGKTTYNEMLEMGFKPGQRPVAVWSRAYMLTPANWLGRLQVEHPDRDIWIAGGGKVYDVFSSLIERWYISKISYDGEADTWLKSFL